MLPDAPVTATRMVLFQLRVSPGSSCWFCFVFWMMLWFGWRFEKKNRGALPFRRRDLASFGRCAPVAAVSRVAARQCHQGGCGNNGRGQAYTAPRKKRPARILGRRKGGRVEGRGGREGCSPKGPSVRVVSPNCISSTHVGHVVRHAEDAVGGRALGRRAHGRGSSRGLSAHRDNSSAGVAPAGAGGRVAQTHDQARARGRARLACLVGSGSGWWWWW
jgi:hypothetical protein